MKRKEHGRMGCLIFIKRNETNFLIHQNDFGVGTIAIHKKIFFITEIWSTKKAKNENNAHRVCLLSLWCTG